MSQSSRKLSIGPSTIRKQPLKIGSGLCEWPESLAETPFIKINKLIQTKRYKEVWKFRTLEVKTGNEMNLHMGGKPKEATVPINIVSTSDPDGHVMSGTEEFDDILSSFCQNFDSGEIATPYHAESVTGSS